MNVRICIAAACLCFGAGAWSDAPAESSQFGAVRHDFSLGDAKGFVILPASPADDGSKPWVWYAPTFIGRHPDDSHTWMAEPLLAAGFAICGVEVGESYGSPAGNAAYSAFYDHVRAAYGLDAKPVLLGQSRGGLMTINWASENPEKVAALAGIYPVCNLESYPGVEKAAGAYGVTAAELAARLGEFNPIERLAPLAEAKIPLLYIHGDVDAVVPVEGNSRILVDRYQALGGPAELIVVEGRGHEVCDEFFRSERMLSFILNRGKGALFKTTQLTFGPKHHFFGYIGHVRTIPESGDGRYLLAMEIDSIDEMPGPDDAARILLLDSRDGYRSIAVDQTRGWNPQQGTMFYWNPEAPSTQFFFNDRDPATGKLFTVLYDISDGLPGRRLKEFRFDEQPVANSGVAQNGGWYMAINYGRLARLRPVTGYPEAYDWTVDATHPDDDGIFRVNVETGEAELVLSYARLAEAIRPYRPDIGAIPLFINHTLWSRDDSLVYAFVRGGWYKRPEGQKQVNIPISFRPDGSELTIHSQFMGGHPEWLDGDTLIGIANKRQALYDIRERRLDGFLGGETTFVNPEGDIALSPDGTWFVNGFHRAGANRYTVYRMADGFTATTAPLSVGGRTTGDLRIDPAPRWNRAGSALIVPGLAADGTRQLFRIDVTVTE